MKSLCQFWKFIHYLINFMSINCSQWEMLIEPEHTSSNHSLISQSHKGMVTLFHHVVYKQVNVFLVTSPAMVIAITKHKKSRETNREKWGKALSRSQLTKFTLMSIYELWCKGLWENGDQKAGLSSQNTANLANLDMGHLPEIYS